MSDKTLSGISNAKLLDGRLVDVAIKDGLVSAVLPAGSLQIQRAVLDVFGALVMPSLVETHTHLDKAFSWGMVGNPKGDLRGAMDSYFEAGMSGAIGEDECRSGAETAIKRLLQNGVTAVRSHVDVGTETAFDHVTPMLEIRQHFEELVDIQLVALMYAPLTGSEGAGNRRALRSALQCGVELIGAAPQLEPDRPGSIDVLLDISLESGAAIDVHLDETLDPSILDLEYLCQRIIERGHPYRVTASHCVSLGVQPLERQRKIAQLAAEAGVSVVCLPQSNLFLQGRADLVRIPRGLAPIQVLRGEGVQVCGGSDNIRDPFNPLGNGDPLETANLLVTAGHTDPLAALEMVTSEARSVLGLPAVTIAQDQPADLLILDADDLISAISSRMLSRRTIRRGRLVSSVLVQRQMHC